MMNKGQIVSIGVDLIEIERMRQSYKRKGAHLLQRLFTEDEASYCLSFQDPSPHLAARFAAKEAVSKALKTGIGAFLSWVDIEIAKSPSGSPYIILSQQAAARFENPQFLLSLSHTKEHAIAFVAQLG